MQRKNKIIFYVSSVIVTVLFLILGTLFLFPYLERVSSKPTETSADWMKELEDELSLDAVILPGTHDSATTYVQLPYFMRCQSLTIREQLEAGFRYLDIRLNEENGKLYFYHSFAKCKTGILPWADALELEEVLQQVYSFLMSHPSETVLFVVKQEGSGEVALFQKTLQEYIEKNSEMWLLTNQVPSLGEARGKVVLFRRYADKAGFKAQSGIALNWSDQGGKEFQTNHLKKESRDGVIFYIQDRYNYSVEDKIKGMEEALLQAKQLGATEGIKIHFASTAGPNSLHHPYQIAKRMNAWFQNKEFEGNIGWVVFDHGDAELAESVYQLNFLVK